MRMNVCTEYEWIYTVFVTEKLVAECKTMFMLSGKLLNVNGYIREQINVNEFQISEFCTISPIIVERLKVGTH